MMTRTTFNNSLWIVSVLLQYGLLALVLSRGLARRFPVFIALLFFYPIRSTVLFLLFRHMAPATYASLYSGLSLADICLQVFVAIEIAVHLQRESSGSTIRPGFLLLIVPCISWAATFAMLRMLPANAPIPPDRLQLFASGVMILLCAWTLCLPTSPLQRRIPLGFAFYGIWNILATAGRTIAAAHHNASSFTWWSYAASSAYLLVVLYWTVTLNVNQSPMGIPDTSQL